MLDGNNVVKINDTKMKIKILLPDNLKGFNEYKVVYILNDEIKETIKAKVEDGYIVFETNHLSQYGIIATSENNPKTFDSTSIYITTGILSLITLIGVTFKLKQNEV
ncbi:repeat protein [Acholeplasma sp. CAG:878]|nr:repeat protein [Acholeplasma sp. CAG:878]